MTAKSDDTPLGLAWAREIKARRDQSHPSAVALETAICRLPARLRTGGFAWPSHWSPVATVQRGRPAIARDASEQELADHFALHLAAAGFASPPSEDERQRARHIQALAMKVRALRSEVAALRLTEMDLFNLVAYVGSTSEPLATMRDALGADRFRVLSAMSDRPGSAIQVLESLPAAAVHALLPPREWNPADPPRARATASLDAFLCKLSVFVGGATVELATACAIAFHPDAERGIRKRAAKHLDTHRYELRPREGLSWGAAELSPLIPLESSVRR